MYTQRISCLYLTALLLGVGEGNHLYFRSAVAYYNILCFPNSKYTEETNVQMEHMQIMLTKKYVNYIQKYKTYTRNAMCFEPIFDIWSCQKHFI